MHTELNSYLSWIDYLLLQYGKCTSVCAKRLRKFKNRIVDFISKYNSYPNKKYYRNRVIRIERYLVNTIFDDITSIILMGKSYTTFIERGVWICSRDVHMDYVNRVVS